jgi:hypothetical protein
MDLYDVREHTEFEHIEIPALDEIGGANGEPDSSASLANAAVGVARGQRQCAPTDARALTGGC